MQSEIVLAQYGPRHATEYVVVVNNAGNLRNRIFFKTARKSGARVIDVHLGSQSASFGKLGLIADLGVEIKPHLKVTEPPKHSASIKVPNVAKLKNKAKVI